MTFYSQIHVCLLKPVLTDGYVETPYSTWFFVGLSSGLALHLGQEHDKLLSWVALDEI